jgi:hypothetical protein
MDVGLNFAVITKMTAGIINKNAYSFSGSGQILKPNRNLESSWFYKLKILQNKILNEFHHKSCSLSPLFAT